LGAWTHHGRVWRGLFLERLSAFYQVAPEIREPLVEGKGRVVDYGCPMGLE